MSAGLRKDTLGILGIGLLCALLSLCLALCLFLSGCASSNSSSSDAQSSTIPTKQTNHGPLRIAVQYNALSIPTVFADDQGYFEEEGLEVEISTFVNGAEENKALEAEQVDLASDGLASVYVLATGQFSWIGESDDASATVAIYVRAGSAPTSVSGQIAEDPDILGSADTLRGLTVVGPAGTMEEWTAISYFEQFGLTPGVDFHFVEMDRDQAVQSVLAGEADAFVATDADYCRIMEDNGFVPVVQGAEATRVPFNNGYVVNNKIVEARPADLVAFLKAVYRAADALTQDPELWAQFAYQFYKDNGKPTTLEDVQNEIAVRKLIVPADFESSGYRLGSGVLDVGQFNVDISALDEAQVELIQQSIDPEFLDRAFDIEVLAATL